MKFIQLDQDTPEWHAWRDAGVTASEIACIFGTSPYKTHWQLWAEKSGHRQPDDLDRNPYVRRGKAYEHLLREKVAMDRKLAISPACVEHPEHSLIRASLDGFDKHGRPWEFKIPSARNFEDVRKNRKDSLVAKSHLLQVQQQILCMGASEGYLVFGSIDDTGDPARVSEYIVLTYAADPVIHEQIIRRAAEFHDAVVNGVPPERDPDRDLFSPPTPETAESWRRSADKLIPLLQRKQDLETELAAIKASINEEIEPIKEILGANKAGEFARVRVLRVDRVGAVDWSKYAASKGDDPKDDAVFDPFRKASTKSYQAKLLHE